jgi:hypothetical protein
MLRPRIVQAGGSAAAAAQELAAAMSHSRPRTEHLARRYLASRGAPPMVEDPLGQALPRLRQEIAAAGRLARLDLVLALGLAATGVGVTVTGLFAPWHAGLALTLIYLHVLALVGVAVGVWAAIVLEKSGPRLLAAHRIARALRAGALREALETAVRSLPAPATV